MYWNWNNIKNLPFSLAMGFCRKKIKKDKELYDVYKSNIAMSFYDEFNKSPLTIDAGLIGEISNRAADRFLNLWLK